MKKFMPYLLPVISITLILGFFILEPEITGYSIKQVVNGLDAKIKISTYSGIVIPEDANVEISLDDNSKTITFKTFVEKTGLQYELSNGEFNEINYKGLGYTGNYEYILSLRDLGFDNVKAGQKVTVKVYYNDYVISQSEAIVPG